MFRTAALRDPGWRTFWQRIGGYLYLSWSNSLSGKVELQATGSEAPEARNPRLHLLCILETHEIGKSRLRKHFGWNILSVAGDPTPWRECAASPLRGLELSVPAGKLFLQLKSSRNTNKAHHNCWLICCQRIDSRFGLSPSLPLLPLLVPPEVHGAIILHMLNDYPMALESLDTLCSFWDVPPRNPRARKPQSALVL